MSWQETQSYFNENPNGVLHRPEDQLSFMKLESKDEIVDINSGSMMMVDFVILGKGTFSLGKRIVNNFLKKNLPQQGTQEIAKSTGRTIAKNLTEQLAMEQVKSSPEAGRVLPIVMNDVKNGWLAKDGWVKMSQNVNGVEIHYIKNTISNIFTDFKFK